MDAAELRLRALEAALAREDTMADCFLHADLYLAWIAADEKVFTDLLEIVRQNKKPPGRTETPEDRAPETITPLPTTFAFSGDFSESRTTVIA